MSVNKKHPILRSIIIQILFCGALVLIGFIFSKVSTFLFKDIIFIGGIFLVLIGSLCFSDANPVTSDSKTLSHLTSQFITNSTLDDSPKEINKIIITEKYKASLDMLALLISGIICVFINFII